jgi:hypothetical protein
MGYAGAAFALRRSISTTAVLVPESAQEGGPQERPAGVQDAARAWRSTRSSAGIVVEGGTARDMISRPVFKGAPSGKL